jgi:ATP-binding cassette subfamily B protein
VPLRSAADTSGTSAEDVSARGRPLPEIARRFWPLTRPDRPVLLTATLLLITTAATDTVAVLMFGHLVDGVVSSRSMSAYWLPAGIWVGAALAGAATTAVGSYLSASAAEHFVLRVRDHTFSHLQRLDPEFFERHPVGDLVARLSGDIETIETLISTGTVTVTASLVSVVFFAGAAFWLRWDLALVVTALLPLLVLLTRHFAALMRPTAHDERSSNGAVSDAVEEGVATVTLAQAHNTERLHAERVNAAGRAWMRARLAEMRLASMYTPLGDLLEVLVVVAVLGVGAWDISQHRLTIGGLLAFATFLGFLYSPLRSLSSVFVSVTAARASADRLAQVLDSRPRVTDSSDAWPHPATNGRLTWMGVHFHYPGAHRTALSAVTGEIRPGRLVLVTGPSGAGKSTVARLLLRFYDPTAGRILLDGVDLRDYSLTALRHSITLLPQETVIVAGTVADNIAYGSSGARPAQIREAARAVSADEFIRCLPQTYDTRLGAGGPQLSGGQRQRIAIARALLRDTPVLVLDEPTTGLDAAATAALMPALRALAQGRTTLLISHDLRLAHLADEIVVLDHGRLVERGTHHELLHHNSHYRQLHAHLSERTAPNDRLQVSA